MLPVVGVEWAAGPRVAWTWLGVASTLYLGVVITGAGILVWNVALRRVPAPRAAIFLNVQPVVGALLGVTVLHEPFTAFTVAGGVLLVAGVWLTMTGPAR
jgi:drug/metabolite transporter (DMT)-like permease